MLAEPPARFRTQLRNSHTDRGGRQVRGVLAFNGGRDLTAYPSMLWRVHRLSFASILAVELWFHSFLPATMAPWSFSWSRSCQPR
jgi:hypothetical protein